MVLIGRLKDIIRRIRIWILRGKLGQCADLDSGELAKKKVLVVAPHPDDEVLGCGGLISRLVSEGKPPEVVILTRGEGSHRGCCDLTAEQLAAERHKLTLDAARILGLSESHIHGLSYLDGSVPDSDTGGELYRFIDEFRPQVIFMPHWGEGWSDHVNAAKLAKSAVQHITDYNPQFYEYCVWMWYYNIWHLDWEKAKVLMMTKEEYELKRQAVAAYVSPKAPCGRPWSGQLPKPFLAAFDQPNELYFEC